MALKAVKPQFIPKRLKAFFYGPAGVGKTKASIGFPAPYIIDTEKGCQHNQYVNRINENNGAVFFTTSYEELAQEIKALSTEKHEYKTLVIDSLTTIFNNLLEEAELKVGTEFGRHVTEANKYMKNLCSLLLRLDMNVVITAHSKNEYGQKMELLGQTFDCYKKLDYLFDLVFFVQKHGKKRKAYIKKTRIEAFEESSSIDFSYEEIANLYGKDIIEKECVPEQWATEDQIIKFKALIDLLKIPEDQVGKKLLKVDSPTLEEVPSHVIAEWIDTLEKKLNTLKLAA